MRVISTAKWRSPGVIAMAFGILTSATPSVAATPSFVFDGDTMRETFDGAPDVPTPWDSPNWDVTVHSRDISTWNELEPMAAMHGDHCDAPPATHETSDYDEAVFQCRDHVMTAINASGYGAIILTPAALIDFSAGEAVLRFDVSTLRTSDRDWWDLWITPFASSVQLPFVQWPSEQAPDLAGHPRDAVHIELDLVDERFIAHLISDGEVADIELASTESYLDVLTPDAARRDTFELRISEEHLTFGMPAYDLFWVDHSLPALDWTQGTVQLGHRSYTPRKADDPADPQPNTWHWDNVEIRPAVPFTMVHSSVRAVGGGDDVETVSFEAASPPDAFLRFAGIGDDLQLSFDGGGTWRPAELQWTSAPGVDEHFDSYWTPMPEGVTEVQIRGTDWWGAEWHVRDISIWSSAA